MSYNSQITAEVLLAAQRMAIAKLTQPFNTTTFIKEDGSKSEQKVKNEFFVRPVDITGPAVLVQETKFLNSTQAYSFDFSLNGAAPSNLLNNVKLPKNNVAAVYGLQLWQGQGANANNRVYRSRGITIDDDSLYNSVVQIKIENSTVIDYVPGQAFRKVEATPTEFDPNSGLVLINPIRILTGELGQFQYNVNLINAISTLAITDNVYLSARLHCVMGQATGKKS